MTVVLWVWRCLVAGLCCVSEKQKDGVWLCRPSTAETHYSSHCVCHDDIIGKYCCILCCNVIFRLGLPAQLISWTANISQWDLDVAWRTMQSTVEGFSSWSWRGFVRPFFLSVLSSSNCESSMLLDFHLSSWQDRITVILLCQSISSCWDKFLSVCCLFHSHLIVWGVQWTFPGQWGYRLVLFISS